MKKWPLSKMSSLPRVDKETELFMDTEGTGLDKLNDRPFLATLSIHDKKYAIDLENAGPTFIMWLKRNMPKVKTTVFHNAKHDIHQLMNIGLPEGVVRNSEISCTYIMETLLNEHRRKYDLDTLGEEYFDKPKRGQDMYDYLADRFGGKPTKKEQMGRIKDAPRPVVAYYGIGDVDVTCDLYRRNINLIEEQDLGKIWNLEKKVTKALVFLERRGVPVDKAAIAIAEEQIDKVKRANDRKLEEMVGFVPNVKSIKDVPKAFENWGIDLPKNRKTGNYRTDKDTLNEMHDPLADLILEQRSVRVMLETFIATFLEHVRRDGRIHCDFNQTKGDDYGTKTGRLSASDPNLQQVPKRNKALAKFIRALFVAMDGYKWLRFDWSQFEFRMFAHYTRSQTLIDKIRADRTIDYHQAVATLTGLERDPYAKQLNLGLVFGMGEGLMAQKCGLPYSIKRLPGGKKILVAGKAAKGIFRKYHSTLPEVKRMLRKAERLAIKRGFVKTIFGRRLRFPNRFGCHKAGGLVFQGSSADMMKKKLVEVDEACYKSDVEFVLPVHDEFNFLTPNEIVDDTNEAISGILEDCPEMRVPVYADLGVGQDWWEASQE